MLFKLVDLASVWVNAEVPEAQSGLVKPGNRVQARVPAIPDQVFDGKVSAILPEVNPATRTVRARIELANRGGLLKPGMFATLSFSGGRGKAFVLIPTEAVIQTGQRAVVLVAEGEGRFRPQEIELGYETGGQSEVRRGLKPGERVVVSGQFLIDSEASLKSALTRLQGPQAPDPKSTATHSGRGKVTAVDPQAGRIELDHEPIASMKWPQMTMEFLVADAKALAALKPGDAVDFELKADPDGAGNYVITRIAPRGSR
jgi:Cu(I)/Ag(I) efflux system membrane fusion protein